MLQYCISTDYPTVSDETCEQRKVCHLTEWSTYPILYVDFKSHVTVTELEFDYFFSFLS
jgi:hypothetical protein